MAAKWVRNKIDLPDDLTSKERVGVGKELLKYIQKRTAAGEGKGNKKFPGYSKAYVQSLDFKNAGKQASKVNLKLSGDMIAAHKVISHSKGQLIHGFENNTPENDRAEGNILGSYGGDPNPKKARDFMGLTKQEIKIIVDLERGGLFGRLRRGVTEGIKITQIPKNILIFLVGEAIFEELVLTGEISGTRKNNGGDSGGSK